MLYLRKYKVKSFLFRSRRWRCGRSGRDLWSCSGLIKKFQDFLTIFRNHYLVPSQNLSTLALSHHRKSLELQWSSLFSPLWSRYFQGFKAKYWILYILLLMLKAFSNSTISLNFGNLRTGYSLNILLLQLNFWFIFFNKLKIQYN